jgi:hypothetical protein
VDPTRGPPLSGNYQSLSLITVCERKPGRESICIDKCRIAGHPVALNASDRFHGTCLFSKREDIQRRIAITTLLPKRGDRPRVTHRLVTGFMSPGLV